MSRYFFSVQAKQDLKQIVDRIARDNPTAARRLAAQIKRKAKATAEFQRWGIPTLTCCHHCGDFSSVITSSSIFPNQTVFR